MGRTRGSAATRRARNQAYVVRVGRAIAAAGCASILLAPSAAAQSTGGAAPQASPPPPQLSSPPPGVHARKLPELRSWRCLETCADRTSASTGSLVRIRGRALARTYEVVFLGQPGDADDVAAAPLRRKRHVVDVKVPLGAAAGPLVVAHHDGLQSLPSEAPLAIAPPVALKVAGAGP